MIVKYITDFHLLIIGHAIKILAKAYIFKS